MDVTWRGAARHLALLLAAAVIAASALMARAHPHTTTAGLGAGWLWVAVGTAGALSTAGLLLLRRGRPGGLALLAAGLVWMAPEWAGWAGGPGAVRTLAGAAGPVTAALALAATVRVFLNRAKLGRGLVAVAAGGAAAAAVARVALTDPFLDPRCWRDCGHNPLLMADLPWLGDLAVAGGTAVTGGAVLVGALLLLSSGGGVRSGDLADRAGAAVLLAGAAGLATARPLGADVPDGLWLLTASVVALAGGVTVAGAVVVAHVRAWRLRVALRRLVDDLRSPPPSGSLEGLLADALGDPALRVCYWSASAGTYVDADGRPAEPPAADEAEVSITRRGEPIAVLACQAPTDAATVAQVLGPAMRLWLENEQLRAATLAELAALHASRRRIVERADDERRRLERDLHDGAQQRVLGLGLLLDRLRARLAESGVDGAEEAAAQAEHDADAVLDALRRIARGIHPELLALAGLRSALADLADAAADLAVRLDVELERRHPAAVELAAYLVVAEVVADARQRAASSVTVAVGERDATLEVTVADDAARPLDERVVAELTDRVAALDGRLAACATSTGARVHAELPGEERAATTAVRVGR